jgi:hypothetical protein
MRRIVFFTIVALASASPAAAQSQQGGSGMSLITDMMIRGRNALNDLKYREADSLARRVLSLGSLLSRQQQIDALQLVAAASYPDEPTEQRADSTIATIQRLIALGATQGIPREMSHPMLDSLFTMVTRASQPAKLMLGSRIPGSVLYVDGQPQGVIQSLRVVPVPPGKEVKLSIRAEGCTPWDSSVVTQAADSIRIGFRNPRCSK